MEFSATPMEEAEERATTFSLNLMLMQAAYSLALDICSIPGSTVTWKELRQISPENLLTLGAIDSIQRSRDISC